MLQEKFLHIDQIVDAKDCNKQKNILHKLIAQLHNMRSNNTLDETELDQYHSFFICIEKYVTMSIT